MIKLKRLPAKKMPEFMNGLLTTLAAKETMISQDYREMVWQSCMEDLVLSRAITGALGNWMRASVHAAGISLEDMSGVAKLDFSGDMHAGSKAWKYVWSAGHGVGEITKPETISEIVDLLLSQYIQSVTEQSKGSFYLNAFNKNSLKV